MKKTLFLTAALAMTTGAVNADTVLGVYAGVQGWNVDANGGFADDSNLADFSFDKETKSSFYVALEHPVPLVPNLKIRRTNINNNGSATLTSSFTFDGQNFTADSNLITDIDLTNTDYVLYYELFDNDLFSFDFGLNIKDVEGNIFVQNVDNTSQTGSENFDGFIPLLYSKVTAEMPLTGLGFYAEGNYLSIDDHKVYEYQAAITYNMMDNLAIDMTLQLGYRSFMLELDDLDGVYSDLEFKGPFAGVEVHF
ncbi:TIGR04219 family outer membrane beta-barrel protein [Neptunicella sp. SCSIO 80796]|uniref:TIGR04219 family outer membrane beta-barrel protein n=1 Tax=Neptunicella plasticusilytica TaxID=3117012 RepID=UPI003A4E2175